MNKSIANKFSCKTSPFSIIFVPEINSENVSSFKKTMPGKFLLEARNYDKACKQVHAVKRKGCLNCFSTVRVG